MEENEGESGFGVFESGYTVGGVENCPLSLPWHNLWT